MQRWRFIRAPAWRSSGRRTTLSRSSTTPTTGGKPAAFTAVTEAFSVLSDADKRKEYDKELKSSETGTIIGNYRVLEAIAEGGFGKTYKGEQIINKQLVCIKHCSEVSRPRARRRTHCRGQHNLGLAALHPPGHA